MEYFYRIAVRRLLKVLFVLLIRKSNASAREIKSIGFNSDLVVIIFHIVLMNVDFGMQVVVLIISVFGV